jgi:PAS domain S-box-containing protein
MAIASFLPEKAGLAWRAVTPSAQPVSGSSSNGQHMPETAPHGLWHAAMTVLFGFIGVALITFAALELHIGTRPSMGIGPGTISLLYLIAIVFVSLKGGFVASAAVTLFAVLCLNLFILPLVPALELKNPLDIVATIAFLITAWVITGIVAQLRERNALLDGLFEQSPQPVALLDKGLRVVRVNREFTGVFGYTPQEARGRRLPELIVPDDLQSEPERNEEMFARGQRVDTETVRQRKDGTQLNVLMVGVPISVSGGRIVVYAMYRDITERKAAEIALQTLSRRLLEVQEAERRHLAREFHDEIGQLLTALRLLLRLSGDSPSEASGNRFAQARSIVDDLIGRVRGLSFDLRPADLDQLGLLAALLTFVERYTTQTGVLVNFKHQGLDRRFPAQVEISAYRVAQEALTNVARHAGVSGVDVHVWADAATLNLQIVDRGSGFDPDAVLKLLRSGGLIGMRERIMLLGGRLSIESSLGAGTTIASELPLDKMTT